LALAFFAYNKKLPLSLRSVFYPILKDKIFGFWGDLIDILAVVACLFGLATSLGLGVQQINSGLNYLFGIEVNVIIQVVLIAGITAIACLSVVSGIDKGVKFLSELNIKIAFVFMLMVLILGPTAFIFKTFANSLGLYLNNFVQSAFFISTDGSTWQSDWSVFYLAWWISWSPFVGMFIARVSKGRTIREFVLAVLIVPSLLSFVWLSVFGGTSIYLNQMVDGQLFATVQNNLPVALFEMIQYLDMPFLEGFLRTALSIIGTVLVISFFVTSSDSGSLVVDNLTSGGKLDSPVPQRVFWACMEGFIAAVLLLIGGSEALAALQTAVISTGLPFAIILILMSFILLDSVRKTYHEQTKIRALDDFEEMIDTFDIVTEESDAS
ncbi:MAG: BCCT family transporter, partial [Acidaminobacteraceae bacterium]